MSMGKIPVRRPLKILGCMLMMAVGVSGCSTTAVQGDAASPSASSATPSERVMALLAEMTLEEKIGQMTLFTSTWSTTGPTMRDGYERDIRAGRVGAIFNAFTAEYTRELQDMAVEETRLGIPLLFGYDVIHGHRTIFPISLGEAASWDLGAIERAARISAVEASAEGVHWTFSPMVDVARDPRWGRVSEGSGEDPYLGSRIAEARVRGYQGTDLGATDTVLATAKHFAAYGAAQAGRDYHTTNMSDRELRETYLPPFQASVDEGVATLMTAFNELNGVPATADDYLLEDILRGEWGFEGFVVTDYTSINEMVEHGYARDEAHAAELAVNSGVDMDMQGAAFLTYLEDAVLAGRVPMTRINEAVTRILTMKERLGLLDDPYRYSDVERQQRLVYASEHLEAARDMARRSMVLLKNSGGVLPLPDRIRSIALVGPLADSKADMIGSWAAAGDRKSRPVTVREGLAARLPRANAVRYARGAGYDFGDTSRDGINEALDAARQADVVVAVVGERWDMTGEAASRTSLRLPGTQSALLRALKETGKPLIVVLMNGRPLALEWVDDHADAVLEAWYPGTMGGHAIADVLFGDYNPSGKLPITYPRNVGQVPLYYNMKNTGRPYTPDKQGEKYLSRYLETPNTPLYPFGYGLSYTSFEYGELVLSGDTLSPGERLTVSIDVTNTGERFGEEVVQLYVRDRVGSVTRPVRQLRGFEKIALDAGQSVTVSFDIEPRDLAFYRRDMTFGYEAGAFEVGVGGSSQDVVTAEFTLTDDGP